MENFKNEFIILSILSKRGISIMNKNDLNESEINNSDNYFQTYYKYLNKFERDFKRSKYQNEFDSIGKFMKRMNKNFLLATKKEILISIEILKMIYHEYDEKCSIDQQKINKELIIKHYHLF